MYDDETAAISAELNASDVVLIAEGTYGITFRVVSPSVATALKLFKTNFDLSRSSREIDSLRIIRSRNVVSLVDDGRVSINGQQRRYLRAEFIDGATLEDRIATSALRLSARGWGTSSRASLNLAVQP